MLKKASALSAIVALSLTAAACGGNTAQETAKSTDAPKAAAGSKKVIKMVTWKQAGQTDWFEAFNKKFEEKYPEYKVDLTVTLPDDPFKQMVLSRLNANDVDIVPHLSSFIRGPKDFTPGADKPDWQQYIESGLLADLTGQALIKNFNENDIKNATTFNNKVYGVPTGTVSFSGMFYNKDIFAKNNLQVPKTWTEFVTVMETLKKNNVTPIAMAGKDKWPIKLAVMGLQASIIDDQSKLVEGLWKGTAKYSDAQPVEVLDKIKTIMDKYTIEGFMGVDYATLPSLFTSGKVAMIADGTWDAVTIAKADPNLKFGYFPIPGSEDAAKNASLAGKYDLTLTVAEKGPNKAGAIKWLEEFSQPENYASFVKSAGFLPTQPNVKLESPFVDELAPYLKGFKLGYEQVMIDRANLGEYINNADVHGELLAPGGPFKTAKDLAQAQQKQWDAAKK
ncbi:ABC transporter substrate-binding protein [Paenibacillus sp. SI8]|uniref:ABC transporter substrate-binding protein n=1 Tax=unclassified Paenibacillus TaxID=185978 RepID=UPI003467C47F